MENTAHPPKPRSQAQIEASRRNGAKSRGPVTPEGKAVSARNAGRHQLFASITAINGESPEDYVLLATELYDAWNPADEHERNLVDTMASCIWRRMRILAMESVALDVQLEKAGVPAPAAISDTFHAFSSLTQESRAFQLLHLYESRYLRAYERASRTLAAYRKARQTEREQTEPEPTAGPIPPAPAAPAPQPGPENRKNEPGPAPVRPLSRRERRLQKWQKAHPKAGRPAPNPLPPSADPNS